MKQIPITIKDKKGVLLSYFVIFSVIAFIGISPTHGNEIDRNMEICVHGGDEDEVHDNPQIGIKLLPVIMNEPPGKGYTQFYSDTIDYLESRLVLHRKLGTGLQSSSDGEGGMIGVLYNIPDGADNFDSLNPIHMYWSYHTSMLLPRAFVKTDETNIVNTYYETRGYRINKMGDTCYVRLIRVPSHGFTIFYDDISADNVSICDSVLNNIQLSKIKMKN